MTQPPPPSAFDTLKLAKPLCSDEYMNAGVLIAADRCFPEVLPADIGSLQFWQVLRLCAAHLHHNMQTDLEKVCKECTRTAPLTEEQVRLCMQLIHEEDDLFRIWWGLGRIGLQHAINNNVLVFDGASENIRALLGDMNAELAIGGGRTGSRRRRHHKRSSRSKRKQQAVGDNSSSSSASESGDEQDYDDAVQAQEPRPTSVLVADDTVDFSKYLPSDVRPQPFSAMHKALLAVKRAHARRG